MGSVPHGVTLPVGAVPGSVQLGGISVGVFSFLEAGNVI